LSLRQEAKVAVEKAEAAPKGAEEALAGLASAIGAETSGLSDATARFDARRGIEGKIAEAERTAMEAGDRLPIATLEKEWANQDLDVVRANLEDARARWAQIEKEVEEAILKEREGRDALAAFAGESEVVNRAIVLRESAATRMHLALERYLELALASDLLGEAMAQVRAEQQDPLVARAGVLFSAMTGASLSGWRPTSTKTGCRSSKENAPTASRRRSLR
jgi:chromosome segregation ATPase